VPVNFERWDSFRLRTLLETKRSSIEWEQAVASPPPLRTGRESFPSSGSNLSNRCASVWGHARQNSTSALRYSGRLGLGRRNVPLTVACAPCQTAACSKYCECSDLGVRPALMILNGVGLVLVAVAFGPRRRDTNIQSVQHPPVRTITIDFSGTTASPQSTADVTTDMGANPTIRTTRNTSSNAARLARRTGDGEGTFRRPKPNPPTRIVTTGCSLPRVPHRGHRLRGLSRMKGTFTSGSERGAGWQQPAPLDRASLRFEKRFVAEKLPSVQNSLALLCWRASHFTSRFVYCSTNSRP